MENIWIASWKHCDWVGKADLVILFLLSIYSWAIMIDKFVLLKRVRRANERFISSFYNGKMVNVPGSPWSRILAKLLQEKARQNISEGNISNLIKRFADEEMSHLNNKIDFLLSISAVAPFMGLLGTVWGILMSFHNIGQTGTSSVSIIASGISEALIVTFVGLLVAIPAALGYNYLNGQVRNIQIQGNHVLEAFHIAIK
ncbi:MAG TPA: MotA/TolQ/ExbB proton channel family protein [bacterium]|nr:MotA/TolQ/ExbB proton channel family protein [bacterium]HOL49960.1 MotA/TolQ/ExbB proton channel family protein [bacterium]HPO51393.1 MotA/TolQ/ExbB proton channel family protein [bacterium]